MSIDLSPAFFDIQLRFADSIVRVCHFDFEEALLNFTNLYLQFIGRSFDPAHPVWQAYLEGLRQASEKVMWTHAFYQRCRESHSSSSYGCFHYSYRSEENTIRYHFVSVDTSGSGSLSKERMLVRLQELRAMFCQIKKQYGDLPTVQGKSWLYNLEAYRRLFPAQYTLDMEMLEDEFQYMSLWGQFLQHDGRVHEHLVDSFLSCLQKAEILKDLRSSFPYQVLSPQGPISLFYEFYKVDELG